VFWFCVHHVVESFIDGSIQVMIDIDVG